MPRKLSATSHALLASGHTRRALLFVFSSLIHKLVTAVICNSVILFYKVIDASLYHLYYIHTAADIAIIQFHLITSNTLAVLFSSPTFDNETPFIITLHALRVT